MEYESSVNKTEADFASGLLVREFQDDSLEIYTSKNTVGRFVQKFVHPDRVPVLQGKLLLSVISHEDNFIVLSSIRIVKIEFSLDERHFIVLAYDHK